MDKQSSSCPSLLERRKEQKVALWFLSMERNAFQWKVVLETLNIFYIYINITYLIEIKINHITTKLSLFYSGLYGD